MSKPRITVQISGPEASGKTTLFRILTMWLERSAGYSITYPSDGTQEILTTEDEYHQIQIIVTQNPETNG